MKYMDVWKFIYSSLLKHHPVGLLLVAENTSGSPGRQGFKMAVAQDGSTLGTIGGGIMEYKLLEKTKSYLNSQKKLAECFPQIHQKGPSQWRSGMICSGTQMILLYTFFPEDTSIFSPVLEMNPHARMNMKLLANQETLSFEECDRNTHHTKMFQLTSKQEWMYHELMGPEMSVSIVGAGHVGAALAKILDRLDTGIKIFDHRSSLPILKDREWSDRIEIGPYDKTLVNIEDGEYSYAVVVSTSYKTDVQALAQLLNKNFKYLGLMGSAHKLIQIKKDLLSMGFSEESLCQLRAPIGMQIKSRSAEEIAISIAAEMIQVKNQES